MDFFVIWYGLLGAPVLAGIFVAFPRAHFFRRVLMFTAGAMLLLYLGAISAGLRFVALRPNVISFAVAYFAYSFLALMCLRIPKLIVRVPSFVLALVPIAFGYWACTFGQLLLALVLGDYMNPPTAVERVSANLECRETTWGYSFTDSGHTVTLYRTWDAIPFLHQKMLSAQVTESKVSGPPDDDPSCADLAARYQKS